MLSVGENRIFSFFTYLVLTIDYCDLLVLRWIRATDEVAVCHGFVLEKI
jgi:hypothetical protein